MWKRFSFPCRTLLWCRDLYNPAWFLLFQPLVSGKMAVLSRWHFFYHCLLITTSGKSFLGTEQAVICVGLRRRCWTTEGDKVYGSNLMIALHPLLLGLTLLTAGEQSCSCLEITLLLTFQQRKPHLSPPAFQNQVVGRMWPQTPNSFSGIALN